MVLLTPTPSPTGGGAAAGAGGLLALAELLSNLAIGLAWPIVVVFVLLRFRPRIERLVQAVTEKIDSSEEGSVSAGSFATFAWKQRIARAEASLESLPTRRTPSETNVVINENRAPATTPADLLSEAHSAVRASLQGAGPSEAIEGPWLAPLAEKLQSNGKIDGVVADAIFVLDDLYQIASLRPDDLDVEKVNEYVEFSRRVIARIPVN